MAKIVKAAAIGALIALTAGAIVLALPALGIATPFAGIFGLGVGIGGAAATTGALLAAAAAGGAFYAALGAIANEFLVKKPGDLSSVASRLNVTLDPQAEGKWLFGETSAGTDIVYSQQHGQSDEYVSNIVAAAAHRIHSFGDLWVNDEIAVRDGVIQGDWNDSLRRQINLGTATQSAFNAFSSDGFSWPSSARGRGVAHFLLRWKIGTDKVKGGIPSRITQVVKGAPVYDPRLDSTVGGTGLHRANNQDTWQYVSDEGEEIGANWALIALFYLLGWRNNGRLVFGFGADPVDIDYTQVIAAANVCDELIDNKPRFRIGGIFPTSNNHQHILSQLEAAIGGSISIQNGIWYIWAPNDDLVPFNAIVNNQMMRQAGVEFIPSGPIEELYNVARGRYISPADLYQPVYYPDVVEDTAVLQDGRERVTPRDFALVQDVEIAQRVAREMVRRSRFSGIWRFSMGPKGLLFRPFDVTLLTCQETNNVPTLVRITAMTFSPAGVVQIECIEEDVSIYDTSAPLGTPITQLDTDSLDSTIQVPVRGFVATEIAITGSAGTSRIAYRGTWDDTGGIVQFTEAQIKVAATVHWLQMPASSFNSNNIIVTDFEPLTLYDFRIRHVSIFGIAGPWFQIQDTTADVGLTHYDDIVHYYRQPLAPINQGEKDNDIWIDSDDNMAYRRISGLWVDIQDDDIEAALTSAISGRDGDDGVPGTDGIGIEYIFTLASTQTIPSSQYPDNNWGYDVPATRGGRIWTDGVSDDVSSDIRFAFLSQRDVPGGTQRGAAVAGLWSVPVISFAYGDDGTNGISATADPPVVWFGSGPTDYVPNSRTQDVCVYFYRGATEIARGCVTFTRSGNRVNWNIVDQSVVITATSPFRVVAIGENTSNLVLTVTHITSGLEIRLRGYLVPYVATSSSGGGTTSRIGTTRVQSVYLLTSSQPARPYAVGGWSEFGEPQTPTLTQDVYVSTSTLTYTTETGANFTRSSWSYPTIYAHRLTTSTQRTQTIYRSASTNPGTPPATSVTGIPGGWSSSRPSTTTQSIWRSSRTQFLTSGSVTHASGWSSTTLDQAGVVTSSRSESAWILNISQPARPSTLPGEYPPSGWSSSQPARVVGQTRWRVNRSVTLTNNVPTSATAWSLPANDGNPLPATNPLTISATGGGGYIVTSSGRVRRVNVTFLVSGGVAPYRLTSVSPTPVTTLGLTVVFDVGVGTTRVTGSVTDAAGTIVTTTTDITVTVTPPLTISGGADQTIVAIPASQFTGVFAVATISYAVSGGVEPYVLTDISPTPLQVNGFTVHVRFGLGAHTVTATVTDAAGTTASTTTRITVIAG